jgi:hypothetical protein
MVLSLCGAVINWAPANGASYGVLLLIQVEQDQQAAAWVVCLCFHYGYSLVIVPRQAIGIEHGRKFQFGRQCVVFSSERLPVNGTNAASRENDPGRITTYEQVNGASASLKLLKRGL